MKWSIVGLIVLGVAAAFAAALLTNSLRSGGTRAAAPVNTAAVRVMRASRALPANIVLDGQSIEGATVPRDAAPAESFVAPEQIVGKVLRIPMLPGQAFTKDCFAQGPGVLLSAKLPPGKRAVALSLPDFASLEGVLFSGSLVDVTASFKLPSTDPTKNEAISTTLLRRIPVLAVDNDMPAAPQPAAADGTTPAVAPPAPRTGPRRPTLVTLMVDSEQAQALQLATEHGSISLALVGPNDNGPTASHITSLSELSRDLATWLGQRGFRGPGELASATTRPSGGADLVWGGAPTTQPSEMAHLDAKPKWETTIIRGGNVEVRSFPYPEARPAIAEKPADIEP